MQRRTAMVGIPREDAETALLGAHIRGCEAEVFESRGDAVTWLSHGSMSPDRIEGGSPQRPPDVGGSATQTLS
jgi:hypothetical protein